MVESRHSIDVNRLNKEGRLRPGLCTVLLLSPGGEDVGLLADHDSLCLFRRVRIGGELVSVKQTVGLVRSPCQLGGERPYFICSGVGSGEACGRRVAKLYTAGRYFLCRHCLGLTYACQKEDAWGRARRLAHKARQRIGGGHDINEPLPFLKPKHMQWRTFSRLYRQADMAKKAAAAAFIVLGERFFGPFD
jgi:hypothetical protein